MRPAAVHPSLIVVLLIASGAGALAADGTAGGVLEVELAPGGRDAASGVAPGDGTDAGEMDIDVLDAGGHSQRGAVERRPATTEPGAVQARMRYRLQPGVYRVRGGSGEGAVEVEATVVEGETRRVTLTLP